MTSPSLASRLRAMAEEFDCMLDRPSEEVSLAAANRLRGLAQELEEYARGGTMEMCESRELPRRNSGDSSTPLGSGFTPKQLAELRADYDAWFAKRLVWRSIETAPKDGTEILIAHTDGDVVMCGRWIEGAWYQVNNDPTDSWGRPWYEHEASHWMPLPPTPAFTADKQER